MNHQHNIPPPPPPPVVHGLSSFDGNMHHSYYPKHQQTINSYHYTYSHINVLPSHEPLPHRHSYPLPVPVQIQNVKLAMNKSELPRSPQKRHQFSANAKTDNPSVHKSKSKTPPPPPPPKDNDTQDVPSLKPHNKHTTNPKNKLRKSEADKLHPIEIEYEYDTDEYNEGGTIQNQNVYHIIPYSYNTKGHCHDSDTDFDETDYKYKNKKRRPKNRTKPHKPMVIVIDECPKDQDKDTLSKDVLVENMIQIQRDMFSHFKNAQMSGDGDSVTNPYNTNDKMTANTKEVSHLSTQNMDGNGANPSQDSSMEMMNAMHSLISPRSDDMPCFGVDILDMCDEHNRMASFASSMNHHIQHFHEEEALELEMEMPTINESVLSVDESECQCIASDILSIKFANMSEDSTIPKTPTEAEMDFNVRIISPRNAKRQKQFERHKKHRKNRSKSLTNAVLQKIKLSPRNYINMSEFVFESKAKQSLVFKRAETCDGSHNSHRHKRRKRRKSNTKVRRIRSADYHKKHKHKKHRKRRDKHRKTSLQTSQLRYSQTSPIKTDFDISLNIHKTEHGKKGKSSHKKEKKCKHRKSSHKKDKKHKRNRKKSKKKHRKKRDKKEKQSKHSKKRDRKEGIKHKKNVSAHVLETYLNNETLVYTDADMNSGDDVIFESKKEKIKKLQIDINAERVRANAFARKTKPKHQKTKTFKERKSVASLTLTLNSLSKDSSSHSNSNVSSTETTDTIGNVILPMSPPISSQSMPSNQRLSLSLFGNNSHYNTYAHYTGLRYVPPSNPRNSTFIPIPPPPTKLSKNM